MLLTAKTLSNLVRRIAMASLTVIAAGVCSCGSDTAYSPELTKALDRAGNNRHELVSVLEHYENEPEKLAAAEYLISNMQGHYSYQGPELDSLETFLAKLTRKEVDFFFTAEELKRWNKFSLVNLPRKDDLKNVTSEILIENIDLAFQQWKKRPWNRNLEFEDFCELLLPYSISDDTPVKWRKTYAEHYDHVLDSLYKGDDVIEAAMILFKYIQSEKWIFNDQLLTPHRTAMNLFRNRVGYSRDWCDLLMYAMRSCGIPVTSDNVMYSPDNHYSYQWIVVRDPETSSYYPIGLDDYVPDRRRRPSSPRTMGKVYRLSYRRQEERMARLNDVRSLPTRLNNPFFQDVTSDYFGHNSTTVPVRLPAKESAYLGLWTEGSWEIIGTGYRDGESVTFYDLEPGVIFAPVRHTPEGFIPCGDAFFLKSDSTVRILRPEPERAVKKVRIRRMTPFTNVMAMRMSEHLHGYTIMASADYAFTDPDTIFTVHDTDTIYTDLLNIALPQDKPYRYLRMSAPEGKRFSIGEMDIYDDKEMKQRRVCPVIEKFPANFNSDYLQDYNLSTRFTLPADRSFFTYDLNNKPAAVVSVSFHTDGNFIYEDSEYEVYYLASDGEWTKIADVVAKASYVDVVAPANALLLICRKNSDLRGQAFIYENGRQLYSYNLARLNH